MLFYFGKIHSNSIPYITLMLNSIIPSLMRTTSRLSTPFVLFMILFLGYSCKDKSKTLLKEFNIKISHVDDSLQSAIKSYTILRLDNQPDAYIQSTSKFIFTDKYMLFKNESKQSIIIYDKSGKYINSISKKGRGPGEYTYISDFMFDEKSREIIICDLDRLKKYSFSGDFLSEQKFDSRISKILKMDNGNLVSEKGLPTDNPQTNFHLRILSDKLDVLDKRLPIVPSGGPGFGIEGQTYRTALNKDYAYFFSYTGDTIYHISDDIIKPVYLLKYDKPIITTTDGSGTYKSDPNESYRQLVYYEIGDISLLLLNYKNQGYCFSFNQLTGQTKSFFTRFPISGVYKDQIVLITNSMYLKRTIERIDSEKSKCKNLSDLDNALLNFQDDFQAIILIDLDLKLK
jgi:hypothetical protein